MDESEIFLIEDSYTAAGTNTVVFSNELIDLDSSITATATDSTGNTSEFSTAVAIIFLDLLFRNG